MGTKIFTGTQLGPLHPSVPVHNGVGDGHKVLLEQEDSRSTGQVGYGEGIIGVHPAKLGHHVEERHNDNRHGQHQRKQNKVEPQLLAWELKVDKSQRPKQGGNDLASGTYDRDETAVQHHSA